MLVKLSKAGEILKDAVVEAKPLRVCAECLADARINEAKLEAKSLPKTLKWKCGGRNCYSSADYLVDECRFTNARKKSKVIERRDLAEASPRDFDQRLGNAQMNTYATGWNSVINELQTEFIDSRFICVKDWADDYVARAQADLTEARTTGDESAIDLHAGRLGAADELAATGKTKKV